MDSDLLGEANGRSRSKISSVCALTYISPLLSPLSMTLSRFPTFRHFCVPVIAHIPSAMQEHKFVSHPRPSPTKRLSSTPHPLDQLSSHEIDIAREAVFTARGKCLILFRAIFTEEPAKAELVPFLEAEHSRTLTSSTPRPARQARVQYDIVHDDKSHDYMESVVDILAKQEVVHRIIDKKHQPALTLCVPHRSALVSRLMFVGRNSKLSKMLVLIRLYTRRQFPSLTFRRVSR
jgi:hypothetical protein